MAVSKMVSCELLLISNNNLPNKCIQTYPCVKYGFYLVISVHGLHVVVSDRTPDPDAELHERAGNCYAISNSQRKV